MKIDAETVKKIAFLSRLNIDETIEDTKKDFNNIFAMIEQFNEVNTQNVQPLTSVNDANLVCRKDEVTSGGNAKAILANAPEQEYGYFVVPKVVDVE
ncbi:MAG: Asp-tRNA(Asn)/Glu-tRNA(Gln) amidotransferase subunit GatC [Alphaproteobacteria bacterium]|nr:Asp-tRNA(Asn)/Glu-tRNA(Gln) amidotransferase subunit GatC [Alphaproteobacteria bacterium]